LLQIVASPVMRKISDRAGLWLAFFVLLAGAAACQSTPHSESRSEAARPKSEPARASTRQANDADRYDLARDEQRGGHTLDKHVGRTDAELRERLDRERDISAASTWTDRATAERTVAAALRANREKIDRWMARGYPRPNLALHFDAGQTIGRSLRHGESEVVPASAAVVVLKANSPDSFYVLTTYPEARE
jgi:Bacterial CdiA-CT RNAse A domain